MRYRFDSYYVCFARIVQWREHGSSKAMILVRFQVWVFIFGEVTEMDYCTSLENWQPSVMAVRGFESHPLRSWMGGRVGLMRRIANPVYMLIRVS